MSFKQELIGYVLQVFLDENPTIVSKLSELIGLQGVIGALPIGLDEQGVFKYNYLKKKIYILKKYVR